ncbi:MAG: rsbU 7 [Bacteroidetes bacterium]|jgi:ligand-binding sensor domain-containing protein/serine phosphatase RsbU (regulator of sigma subunit)|nr:rsbU 7 [Bacteroidota bacterium]
MCHFNLIAWKRTGRAILFLLLPLLFLNKAPAQTTSFITYAMEQGLIQNQVESIVQDDEGNLWISTIAGLTRYDGSKFVSYTKNQGLAEDWITTSYKDSKGNLWFGHWAGGVTRYNVKLRIFENLNLEQYTHFKSIRSILEDTDGKFWIATEGAGVFIFDPGKNAMFSIQSKDGLSSNTVYDMVFDEYNNIWFAGDSGVVVYNKKNPPASPKSYLKVGTTNGLFSDNITSLYYSSQKELWMGSADKGAVMIPLNGEVTNIQTQLIDKQKTITEANGLQSSFIKTIREDHFKNIWIGTIGGGVSKLAREKGINTDFVFKTYSTRQGLNYFNVSAIFEDREKTVWIGTDLGLNQFRGERIQIFDEADSIPNNIIWSTYCDRDGNVWTGTNNGLARMSFSYTKDNIESHTLKLFTEKNGLNASVILSVFQDSKGNIWVGTGFSGAYMLAPGQEKFVQYNTAKGLGNDMVYSVAEDKQGNIWFGTKEGASKLNPASGVIRNYTTADGLGGNHIYRIFQGKNGLLWIGALGGNLTAYDGTSFKRYDETNGLKHRFILCIDEDKNGNLWFGCYGGGLYKYDGNKFTNYGAEQGLHNDSPFSVIADEQNNIWIGNNHGIEKFDVAKNKFVFYGRNDGFMGVECNPNSACIDQRGNLWFGTIMGAVKFNPNEDLPNEVAPLTQILGLKMHLIDTVFPSNNEFRYNENNLTFSFIGICLTNPEKVKYEYSLDGFDRGWVPVNHLVHEATYTNLPPGKYVFKVRASNNDGVWSEPTAYSFTVKPPFWQTALFYVAVVIFIVFTIFVYDRVRTRKLKKAKHELERKVEERTIQLAIMNAELAEKNKDITDSIRYAKRIQEGSLVSHNDILKTIPDSFILFNPKDIVSGDFTWIKEKNNAVYIGVIDCTGHGVPGAFLSIVANNLLEKTFAECGDTSPAALLDHLSRIASTALHSSTEGYQLRDGMDIALCKIDRKNNKVEFSGAYNSLYLIRENKLIEYPADHFSIGVLEDGKQYQNHSFNIEKGDQLYMFTDGFADQFGGDKGKKYKYHHFQEFLVKINTRPAEEQRKLLQEEFIEWKKNLEQVDDVTVIGIRL